MHGGLKVETGKILRQLSKGKNRLMILHYPSPVQMPLHLSLTGQVLYFCKKRKNISTLEPLTYWFFVWSFDMGCGTISGRVIQFYMLLGFGVSVVTNL